MLDIDFVRCHFPAFNQDSKQAPLEQAMFENAGGSYPCQQTISRLTDFYQSCKLQPGHPHKAGLRAARLMASARSRWAQALNVSEDELQFGPSTSANTYVLAQAFGQFLPHDAQVIVTNQDHEANGGAVRRMAQARGLPLREWQVDRETGQLDANDLDALLSPQTALVCLPHCSNIIGQVNPVADWCQRIKAVAPSAVVMVDGVSHAPHSIPDVSQLGCDIYVFSLYKVYSVHQGLMVVRLPLLDKLPNQGHYFNASLPNKRLTPAGPDHAQEAASQGVLDYIQALDAHHHPGSDQTDLRAACQRVSQLWHDHEAQLQTPLLDYLAARNDLRLLGPASAHDRHGTIAFCQDRQSAWQVAAGLGERGFAVGSGHFYAARLLDHMGVGAERGVTRLSLVHYNTMEEVKGLIQALDEVLN